MTGLNAKYVVVVGKNCTFSIAMPWDSGHGNNASHQTLCKGEEVEMSVACEMVRDILVKRVEFLRRHSLQNSVNNMSSATIVWCNGFRENLDLEIINQFELISQEVWDGFKEAHGHSRERELHAVIFPVTAARWHSFEDLEAKALEIIEKNGQSANNGLYDLSLSLTGKPDLAFSLCVYLAEKYPDLKRKLALRRLSEFTVFAGVFAAFSDGRSVSIPCNAAGYVGGWDKPLGFFDKEGSLIDAYTATGESHPGWNRPFEYDWDEVNSLPRNLDYQTTVDRVKWGLAPKPPR